MNDVDREYVRGCGVALPAPDLFPLGSSPGPGAQHCFLSCPEAPLEGTPLSRL